MPTVRSEMRELLKELVVLRLKKAGFKGSFPKLYRQQTGHTDILEFYFRRDYADQRFFVAATRVSNDGLWWHRPTSHIVEPKKVRISQVAQTVRLGQNELPAGCWFDCNASSYQKVAEEVCLLLDASDFWERLEAVPIATEGDGYRPVWPKLRAVS